MHFKLLWIFILCIISGSTVFAGGIEISQSSTSDWGSGFCENVSLKNTGNTETTWSEFSFSLQNSTITSLWGGTHTISDGRYRVKPASWNTKIPAGSSISVGYCANGSGRPTNLEVSGGDIIITPPPSSIRPTTININKDGLSLISTVASDWNTGYCRNITLKNTLTNTPITNWNISFDLASDINLWSAKKTKNNITFTISPESWNAKLGQTEFGFCVSSDAVDGNWQITQVKTGEETPPPTPINGVCGSDNNKTLSYPPTNLCTSGTPSTITGNGPWTWNCEGKNGGTSTSCQANKSTIITPPSSSNSGIVMAYYPSWARYSYTYDKIDYSKFDIINHAFVFPSLTTGIKVDADYLYPELVSSVHRANKKILVSVGNIWGDPVFGTVMANPTKRQAFMTALKKFVEENNYDGVDIDWEFPLDANEGKLFLDLIRDLKIALPGKLVTVAISVLPHDFDLATLSTYADYINIMTYDMEAWYNYAGYNAPLYRNSKMPTDTSIDHYIKTTFSAPGIDSKKLILGVPLYGRKFATQNPYESSYQSTAIEYKDLPTNCIRKWDNESLVPYLSCNGFYISYDDAESLRYKQEYANTMKLGGIFFWALGQDNGAIVSSMNTSSLSNSQSQSTMEIYTQSVKSKTIQNTKKTSTTKKQKSRKIRKIK